MMWVTHNASIGGEVRGTEDFVNQLQVREAPVLDVGELRHLRHCHQALVIHIMVQPHHLANKVLAGEFSCKEGVNMPLNNHWSHIWFIRDNVGSK